jgi:hypothetical protein
VAGPLVAAGACAGNSGDNFEIDLEEADSRMDRRIRTTMRPGISKRQGTTFGGVTDTGTNLTSGFNTYGIDRVPGKSITYYVNGTGSRRDHQRADRDSFRTHGSHHE